MLRLGYLCCRYRHDDPAVRDARLREAALLRVWIERTHGVTIVPWWTGIDPAREDTGEVREAGFASNINTLRTLVDIAMRLDVAATLFVDGRYPPTSGMRREIDAWRDAWVDAYARAGVGGVGSRSRDLASPIVYIIPPWDPEE